MFVAIMVSTFSSGMGKPWDPVCIPYHDGIYSTSPIPQENKGIRPIYLAKESMYLSWNSGRDLLGRSYFSKWDKNVTASAKTCNVNVRFLINRMSKDINEFRRLFQESIQIYIPKAQVRKSKIQPPS